MRRICSILFALMLAIAAMAQTLNVKVGNVTYLFPAAQTGDMTYANGSSLTIMGKTFSLSDIDAMTIDNTKVTDNTVNVSYNGTTATVAVAGNVAQYVTPSVSGAHVTIDQSNTTAVDDDEITYQLSGTTTDGSLTLSGSYKCTISLAGVTLTNPSGAAINITNSKRIQLSAKKNTENTLTDGSNGSQKACLYSKGQLQLQGNGTLNVIGNTNHAIKSASYITVKNLTLSITSAVGDGINCEEYFQMKSGNVTISGTGDDGIQCDLGGTTSTGETTDHDDEDSGNIYIEDGTINITTTAAASKGIKAAGDMMIGGGTIDITTTGKYAYDNDDKEYKSCACLNADGNMTINGGTLTLKSTGYAGKCIKCDNYLTVNEPAVISATATGSSNSTYGSAKAIKAGTRTGSGSGWNVSYTYAGGIIINGGTITASASSHEAIESKSTIDINGGIVYAYSKDDAINSASTFTITGGFVMGNSTGNDGLDANGNFYIKGGTVFAVAARSPEVGIDANTEGGYKLFVSGGNIVSIGGLESGSSLTQSCYQASSYSKGSWYGLYSNSSLALAFKVPSNSNMGTPLVVSSAGTVTLKKDITTSEGTSIWDGFGVTGGTASNGSSVNLTSYTGGGGGHGPGH